MATLSLHCYRLWTASHQMALRFVDDIADLCSRGWDVQEDLAPPAPTAVDAVELMRQIAETENQMVVQTLSLLFLERLVEQLNRCDSVSSDVRELCDKLLWALMERAAKLNYAGQGQVREDLTTSAPFQRVFTDGFFWFAWPDF